MSDTDDLNWATQNWVLGHLLTLVNRAVGESNSLFWGKLWAGETTSPLSEERPEICAPECGQRLIQEWATSKWKHEKKTKALQIKYVRFRKSLFWNGIILNNPICHLMFNTGIGKLPLAMQQELKCVFVCVCMCVSILTRKKSVTFLY